MPRASSQRRAKRPTEREQLLKHDAAYQYLWSACCHGRRHTSALIDKGRRFAGDLRKWCAPGSIMGDLYWSASYWARLEDKRALARLDAALAKVNRVQEIIRQRKPPEALLMAYNIEFLVEAFKWINAIQWNAKEQNARRFLGLVVKIVRDAEVCGLIEPPAPR